ncbi:hypothetical protein PWEIH_14174 [Listeria weihenstephanensis FSL R9-0317]|uniref:DUF1775 domain-containing protein n=1 Tax=Listeria weihenstephanensis TaxID=1006155 RepID=A0A1S7FTA8_9LIST|nr:DUF1775 domain-containing protein [Listeria weihenstephanensis]AQY50688.1 hypothetical protein UE46_06345 [Listeria weihenstephanensis]EUJ36226.1 hypothetical protein PWEIH_14174 [Listeria weihenstephanensis FSL R9-0317]MBC1499565.1 DUF1775 domain-containing protein [Listeria weihenstephanensis]
MKKLIGVLMAGLMLVVSPVLASAHVSVAPTESTTGAWETYTVKVPVEKDSATIKLVVKIPTGVAFQSYEPVPGWNVAVNKADSTVTWTAAGKGIQNGEFQRFSFIAQNPDKAGAVNWNAYQYYQDGSIVEWTGDADADYPHATTTISKAASESAADSHGKKATESDEKTEDSKNPSVVQWVSLGIAILALVIAVWSFLVRRKK